MTELSEAWEYYEPDPEVAELLEEAAARGSPLDRLADDRLACAGALGLRYGSGGVRNLRAIKTHLAPEKAPRPEPKTPDHMACAGCGTSFRPAKSVQRYCSLECRPGGRARVLPDRQCEACGRTFRPRDVTRRYCSVACRRAGHRAPAVSYPAGYCKCCGKVIAPSRSPNQKNVRVFCSKACSRKWRGRAANRK